jgi:hypothetical protein
MMEQLRLGRRVNGVTMTLLKTPSFTRDCSSTDPRDKVFGIYGISEDAAEGIEIDYTKPVEAVYTDVSRFLIADAKDLTLLSLMQTQIPLGSAPHGCLTGPKITKWVCWRNQIGMRTSRQKYPQKRRSRSGIGEDGSAPPVARKLS